MRGVGGRVFGTIDPDGAACVEVVEFVEEGRLVPVGTRGPEEGQLPEGEGEEPRGPAGKGVHTESRGLGSEGTKELGVVADISLP